MPTRDEVITAIETINDNGNNTAQEVRTVLTALLDYTENDEVTPPDPTPTTEWFRFASEQPISDGATGARLSYSIRGVKETFANLTFSLNISDNSNNNIFSFPLQEDHAGEVFELMKGILQNMQMPFVIPLRMNLNDNIRMTFPFACTISFQEREDTGLSIVFDIDPWSTQQTDGEFSIVNSSSQTSVCFHSTQRVILE